jgi:DNA-binding MarR family transcriptional regulator
MLTVAAPGRRGAPGPKETDIAFLLAQLGAFAAGQFGERAAEVGFTPPEAGLLRLISRAPGQSQQQIAAQLGTRPSRLVALVDGLEQRGLLERRRNTEDRRNYALHLTDAGRDAMAVLGRTAAAHEAAIAAPLSPAQRRQLSDLLARLAAGHGLRPGIHPGYRHLPGPDGPGRD